MPYFEIVVQHSNGQPAKGRRVSSNWDYKDTYTDSDGKAVVEAGRAEITVFVDGKDRGKIRPGRSVFNV